MMLGEVNILVVDDVAAVRSQVKELLKSCGFKSIKHATSGAEAMTLLATEKFQLILADWQMVPLDGLELLKFVRMTEDIKRTPFIMVTAESTRERVVGAITAGVDDYLVKPLTPVQIQNKVLGVLLKRGIL